MMGTSANLFYIVIDYKNKRNMKVVESVRLNCHFVIFDKLK